VLLECCPSAFNDSALILTYASFNITSYCRTCPTIQGVRSCGRRPKETLRSSLLDLDVVRFSRKCLLWVGVLWAHYGRKEETLS
jgi:hypothetical protein